ncbi:MscS mechanosensitive ion channel [Salinisphaera sp. S4-8]
MNRVCASRSAFDAVRIFVVFVVLMVALIAPQAMAQQSQGDTAGGDAAKQALPLTQLADLLENDEARAQIVDQLRQAAQSGNAEATDSALPAPPESGKDPALEKAPDGEGAAAEQAAASQERVSFARRFAQTTAGWAEVIGERVSATWAMLTSLDEDRGPGPEFDMSVFIAAVTTFALVAVATVVSFFVLRLLAGTLFSAIGRFSQRAETGAGVLIRRGTAIVLALIVDVAVVLLACGAGYLAGLYAFGETGSIGTRESLFINAFALIELTKVAIRAVFAARYESLRLLNIPSSVAEWWSVRLRWFVGIIGYGLLVLVPIINVQLSFFLGAVVSFVLMGGAYLYALVVIFRNRQLFNDRLQRMSETASIGFFGVLFKLMSKLWVILAVAYFTTLFVSSQVDPNDALPFMLSATLETLVAAAVALGISGLLSKAIGKRVTFSDNVRAKLPMLEARVNSYVPTALKVIRVLILVAFALVVANAWHLFDLGAWLASDAGLTTVSTLIRVGIVLSAAALLWLIAASIIEHRLNPNTGSGKPSARQETLLELFRNALAILIITMTLMISLSQIGVDIGPLIAGAGVLGLAIGFGAQKLVQDIITGVFIQLENAMNTGDVVTVGGVTGTAERLTIRSVGIRDLDGSYHIVPFSSASTVTNYQRDFAYFRTEYGIGYREDIDNAVYHLRQAFEELKADENVRDNILEDMTVPGVTALADSSVNIRIMIKTKPGTQWGVGRAFNRLVKMHFDRAGIEIPFPHQTIYFGEDRDGKAPPANLRIIDAPVEAREESAPRRKTRKGDDAAPEETGDAPADT